MTGLAGWLMTLNLAQAQAPQPWPGLQIRPVPGGVDLLASPSGESPSGISGEWRLQRSSDLEQWEDVLRGPAATFLSADATLLHHAAADTPQMFWRLVVGQQVMATASHGDEVFGFAQALASEQAKHEGLSLEAFARRYAQPNSWLTELGFDPEAADYFDEFQLPLFDRVRALSTIPGSSDGFFKSFPLRETRLAAPEQAIYAEQGMVATLRTGAHSFADAYYQIFNAHLPVMVTADSVLHAWHRTYAAMLKEQEEVLLVPEFEALLRGMHDALPGLAEAMRPGELQACLHDADLYLSVALNLMEGRQADDLLPSRLGSVDAMVRQIMEGVGTGSSDFLIFPQTGKGLFGREGGGFVDFSQMKPRGHYTSSDLLKRYFRAAMWCGRIDLRVAGPKEWASPRELGVALVLNELLKRSEMVSSWQAMDEILRVFVGVSDSMNFLQLEPLYAASGLDLLQLDSLVRLEQLQASIESGDFGLQGIISHNLVAKPGAPLILPRSFTVFGQKFVPDSWALSQLVAPRIQWQGKTVDHRRLPSALDVAFTVLGQPRAADWLVQRVGDHQGVPFRDGLPIQHQLASLHEVFDGLPEAAWQSSAYTLWLNALRQLSKLPQGPGVPRVFQTSAWADRVLNTQLGSWTQLRHDTVLYAKQSVTPGILCDFPHSYLEPVPAFWEAMADLSHMMADSLDSLSFEGVYQYATTELDWVSLGYTLEEARFWGLIKEMNRNEFKDRAVGHLRTFGRTMERLHAICLVQQAGESVSEDQRLWLKDMMEIYESVYAGLKSYNGWYPELFYIPLLANSDWDDNNPHPSDEWDALVTDVHTDSPDVLTGDPGAVLHEGVGSVAMMMVAIDCPEPEAGQPKARTYAGPIFTHYEFGRPVPERMTDEAWKSELKANKVPPLSEWASGFLVPGRHRN